MGHVTAEVDVEKGWGYQGLQEVFQDLDLGPSTASPTERGGMED